MYNPLSTPSPTYLPSRCRLLAILGNSQGINLEEDQESLRKLQNVEIEWLPEPLRKELYPVLWRETWDILFFAGHSDSEEDLTTGSIAINSQEKSLNLQELKNTLRRVQQNGLKLAIFNSCNGLGLANALVDLGIPYIIVMRDPVPDRVAQDFLKFFLEKFSTGISLHTAFREAREQLEYLDKTEYPGAVQIPVIVQHPTAQSLIWPQHRPSPSWFEQFVTFVWKQHRTITLAIAVLVGLVTSAFVWSPGSELLCQPIGNCNSQVKERIITKKIEQATNIDVTAKTIADIEQAKKILNSISEKINTLSPENEIYRDYMTINTQLDARLTIENKNQILFTKTQKKAQQAIDDTDDKPTVNEMRAAITQLLKARQELQKIKPDSLFYNQSKKMQQQYENKVKDFEKQIEQTCNVDYEWQPQC
ncbi:MAG: CHAT domain-containing protein [Symploca sp. SIO2C1]|nr:CHAT domain-containing protein [Symploca sp. SIO2C1]